MSARALRLPLEGERVRLVRGESDGEFTVLQGGETVGAGAFQCRDGDLAIERICIEPAHRGYGAGSEAARLLIDAAREAALARVRSCAPPDLGLAVYFWFRMGLRPLHGDGPEGGIWFEANLGPG